MATTASGNPQRAPSIPTQDTTGMQPFVPNYSFVDELPFPDQVGVRRGNSLDDVGSAIRGVAFYSDMIGFGAPSSRITRDGGRRPFPMGINYFVKTSNRCSNGADMWTYVNGIPKGDILGARVGEALRRLQLPELRGLSTGILEDARDALNPVPMANAVFGSGYARCKQVTLPVGDVFGKLKGSDGSEWIRSSYVGDIKYINGLPHQKRFVFDKWLTKEEYDKEVEMPTHCPDGARKESHAGNDCNRPIVVIEGMRSISATEASLPVALLLTLGAVLWVRYSKK